MGATSKFPTGGPQGSGYYNNVLNNQKQEVAVPGQAQQAQAQPGQPPNRPGDGDSVYLNAYNNYLQQHGQQNRAMAPGAGPQQSGPIAQVPQGQPFPAPGQPAPAPGQQQVAPGQPPMPLTKRPQFDQNRRPGIRMGGGYASRT
jgi:hypothetical protein